MKRYQALALKLEALIEGESLRPGERVPSIRHMSRQQGVSVSTVMEAYRLLEDRGLLEARPQSGHYVRRRPPRLASPDRTRPAVRPRRIEVCDVADQLARDTCAKHLVRLGNADPDPGLLPVAALERRLRSVCRGSSTRHMCYEHPPSGAPELRAQIARRLLDAGCALTPDDLIVTNGAFEAVHLALRAVCKPGDVVAVETPVHFILLQMLQVLGLKVLEVGSCPEDGLYPDELEAALGRHRVSACLVTPNFSNPVGASMPAERLERLVEVCARAQVPLIEDDVYGELHFAPRRGPVAKAFDPEGWVLHCSSFSKSLCPGFRVGWIAAGRFAADVRRLKYVTNYATATLPQLAVAEFLADGGFDRHLRRATREYAERMRRMTDGVARHFPAGTTVSRPTGGFVLWVGLPGGVDAMQVYRDALARGVSIVPGHLFSATEAYASCIRLAYSHDADDAVEPALEELGAIVGRLAG